MRRAIFIVITLLIVLLIVAIVALVLSLNEDTVKNDVVGQQKAQWQKNGISAYQITVRHTQTPGVDVEHRLIVQDGAVTAYEVTCFTPPADDPCIPQSFTASDYTIEALFALVQNLEQYGAVSMEFDSTYAFPAYLLLATKDNESHQTWRVTFFQVLPEG